MQTAVSRPVATRPGTSSVVVEHTGESQRFRLPAVDRAMNLLELLASSRAGLTLSELSRKLSIPKSTTYYLLYTLVTRGYVQRSSSGHYSLGFRFADVASASTAGLNLNTLAEPHLRQIAARLNLTAMLAVLGGAEAVIIAKVTWARDGDGGGGAWVGRHLDLHCTAQGKALTANLPEDELDKLLSGRELAHFTHKTIDTLPALKAHLAEIRATGYSVNDEEHVLGIRAVGAPIFDSWGGVMAAISVRGSTQQIPSSRLRELGGEMVRAARDMSLQFVR
jgi:DNA-binding IclR family transcriptional regulator